MHFSLLCLICYHLVPCAQILFQKRVPSRCHLSLEHLLVKIVGICWFVGWDCCDEVVRETSIAGINIYSVGDEVDGFLGTDMGAAHGDFLKIGGRSKDVWLNDVWKLT